MAIIENRVISTTSGSGDSASQVFLSNTLSTLSEGITVPNEFNVPVYTLNGATFNYYTQTTDGISASLNGRKSFTFTFSSNTSSLSGTTKMKHDIYKIDYNVFTAFTSNNIPLVSTVVDGDALVPLSTRLIASLTGTTLLLNSLNTALTLDESAVTEIAEAAASIEQSLANPFYTVYEEVSGSTFLVGNAHLLNLTQKVKPTGLYTQDLFLDKSQYFIDSTFLFEQPIDQTLGDVQMFSGDQIVQLYDMPYSSHTYLQTSSASHTVTGGTFSGSSISGASFTYFVPPKKADIFVLNGRPTVEGVLSTFAPIFNFRNVEDGDYYKVQVSYNTGDTSFTGETTIFRFERQIGNADYIRAVAAAVTPNSEFLYRIGNTKEITNLFTVKQNITTWSESIYATSSNDGTFVLSGKTWIGGIDVTPSPNVLLTLTIQATISSVDLGSDALTNPDITSEVVNPLGGSVGSTITVVSDSNGYFTFGTINGGVYLVTAQHSDPANFPTQTINVLISDDTNLDVVFSILWGNQTIDFQQPYTFL